MTLTKITKVSYFAVKQYSLLPYLNTFIGKTIATFLMDQ